VAAAKLLGMKRVPCVRLSEMTSSQKRAYVLADNKLALNAGWDEGLLAIELEELAKLEIDIELTGFSALDWFECRQRYWAASHGNGLHLAGGPTSCDLFCSAGGCLWPIA
jgi:hypothetical protein